jgi:hypothetical protein
VPSDGCVFETRRHATASTSAVVPITAAISSSLNDDADGLDLAVMLGRASRGSESRRSCGEVIERGGVSARRGDRGDGADGVGRLSSSQRFIAGVIGGKHSRARSHCARCR